MLNKECEHINVPLSLKDLNYLIWCIEEKVYFDSESCIIKQKYINYLNRYKARLF